MVWAREFPPIYFYKRAFILLGLEIFLPQLRMVSLQVKMTMEYIQCYLDKQNSLMSLITLSSLFTIIMLEHKT